MASLVDAEATACYAERISKETEARRSFLSRWASGQAQADLGWRPVEPFERTSSSMSPCEMPPRVPRIATTHPELVKDSVGDLGLAGGTSKRFGGKWDTTANLKPRSGDKLVPVAKKGPHDCYCEVGFGCFSEVKGPKPHNFGRKGTFEREFWTNTPGCLPPSPAAHTHVSRLVQTPCARSELALVWDYKGKDKKDPLAELDVAVAGQ